ncbi:MAG: hypothetical protein HYV39_02480 [Candidatus Levybacteria bacterium]|nr:hypothetical protein [Candidatus Levybacteria bacterium]
MSNFKLLYSGYLIAVISLFFFSFTQVDLGLTLTEWSVWQVFQKFFQQIGYFQRPFSTVWYMVTIVFLSLFYVAFLILAQKKLLSQKQIWIIIFAASGILFFSYNAFSYDLFNYIFDAKIVTYYHQNPYQHKALDYPGDPMLSFMHWTHRTYPYGPIWLITSIPLSFLGFGFLLLTMMLFKGLAFISFLGTTYYIQKILQRFSPQNELFGMIFFALNPLVLVESLVSAHNDIFMIFLSVWAINLLLDNKYYRSFLLLILSIGVKFASIFLFPIFMYKIIVQRYIFYLAVVAMIIPVIFASFRTTYQPWYLLYVLPFAAFIAQKYFVLIPSIVISLISLLEYVPFFYLGNWDPPVPTVLFWTRITGIIVSLLVISIWWLRERLRKNYQKHAKIGK